MKNIVKTIRTISAIMDDTQKVKIAKDSVNWIINYHNADNIYQDIKVLRLDKCQLEKNVDERKDAVAEVTYTPSDYILEEVEKKYKFIVFQLLTTITAMGLVQPFTTLEVGNEFRNCLLNTIIMKLDCIEKYNNVDVIVASNGVFVSYKLSNMFELFASKDQTVQQEFIKRFRLFEDGNY